MLLTQFDVGSWCSCFTQGTLCHADSWQTSVAARLLKVYREYGSKLSDASESNSNYAPVRNLTYSQAVIPLGIPEEGREQFIIDMDIEGMTNQEFRKAVNERTQARQEKAQALEDNADLQKTVEDQSGIITGLTEELNNLKTQLENVKTSKAELDKTARQLKDSLESLQQSSSAKGHERMKTNFINTSLKDRANHIAFLCENLDETIKEVKHKLLQIAPNDKETYIDKLGRVEWHFTVPNPLRTVLAQLTHTAPHTIIYIK